MPGSVGGRSDSLTTERAVVFLRRKVTIKLVHWTVVDFAGKKKCLALFLLLLCSECSFVARLLRPPEQCQMSLYQERKRRLIYTLIGSLTIAFWLPLRSFPFLCSA